MPRLDGVEPPANDSSRVLEPNFADAAAEHRLPGDDPANRSRVPQRAVWYWRLWGVLVGLPLSALVAAAAMVGPGPGELRWSLAALLVGYLLLGQVVVIPPIRRRVFWYAISADEVDLQQGWLTTTRTVVPMNRVQHLDTRRGPVADRFGLASIDIHTAAGKVTLPGLDRREADLLRARIGALAGLADDV